MAGMQFGRILSFSFTLHTWELAVTSEVKERLHCWDIKLVISASLFLNERTLRSSHKQLAIEVYTVVAS